MYCQMGLMIVLEFDIKYKKTLKCFQVLVLHDADQKLAVSLYQVLNSFHVIIVSTQIYPILHDLMFIELQFVFVVSRLLCICL